MSDDKSIGWGSTRSFVRLETDGAEERLHVDYAISVSEPTRKNLLLHRIFSVIAAEEKRLYSLTDADAIKELDVLKAERQYEHIVEHVLKPQKIDFPT